MFSVAYLRNVQKRLFHIRKTCRSRPSFLHLLMFERKATQKLLAWKKRSNQQTVLLIKGAQQVGKCTLAQEFGRRHYKSTLTIDFASISDDLKSLFLELRTDICRLFLAHLL